MTCKYKVKIKDIQYNYKVQMTDIQSKYKFKVFCTGYDDSEIKEKIDAMYQAWPKVSGEGETITLNDTANTTMAIDLKGNTYQETTTGKNLLNVDITTMKNLNTGGTWNDNVYTHNGLTITINKNKTIKINGTSTAQETLLIENKQISYPTGTYYLSGSINGNNSLYDIRIFNYDGTSVVEQCFTGTKEVNIINNSQYYNLAIVVRSGQTLNNVLFYPMLTKTQDNTYEPYTNGASPNPDYPQDIHIVSGDNTIIISNSDNTQSASYPINLGDIELCKIGTYKDRIYPLNGKWYLEKNIGKVVLDSTYRQSGGTTGTNAYYISTTINGLNDNSLALSYSNMFQPCSFNNRVNGLDITYLQNGNLAIRTANNTSLDWSDNTKRDNWLNANKPICYYVLATPTTEEITDSTLISQLEEIKKAESYSGQTNISQTNDDKPFILTAKALKDLSSL